jgi:hypothetical protein
MLGIGSSYLGFCCLRLRTCHFLSSSRGSSFPCIWVSRWLSTWHRARRCQLLVYIYRNQSFHMGNYMLFYWGVCLEDPPRFYVNPARKSISKAIALIILCILMSLELDGVRIIFQILFVNCLVVFIFIELYCFIKLYFCYQTSLVMWWCKFVTHVCISLTYSISLIYQLN